MPFKINITSNAQNHNWSGVSSHVDRDYEHDSNTEIDPEYTKYNKMLSTTDLKPTIKAHFTKLVAKHDQSSSVKKNPERAYKSVKRYLRRRRGKPESTIVLKIGKMEDKPRIISLVKKYYKVDDKTAINGIKQIHDKAFREYIKGYKKRHPLGKSFMPMGHAETNEDESGADHLHYNIADLGYTTKGNASMGFSYAVCAEYHVKNRHKAMHLWHIQEDKAMTKCLEKAYQKYIDPSIKVKLTRTGKAFHLGQPIYKGAERKKDKAKQEAKLQFQRLKRDLDSLAKQNINLKKANQEWSQCYSQLESQDRMLKAQIAGLMKSSLILRASLTKSSDSLSAWAIRFAKEYVSWKLKSKEPSNKTH